MSKHGTCICSFAVKEQRQGLLKKSNNKGDLVQISRANTPFGQWSSLFNAIRNVFSSNQTVNFWYSYMQAGNTCIDYDDNFNTVNSTCVSLEQTTPQSITHTEWGAEVEASFAAWKAMFESVFNRFSNNTFTLNFTPRNTGSTPQGDETGTSIASSVVAADYSLISGTAASELVGDFRMAMIPVDGQSSVLAFAYLPLGTPQSIGNAGGDFRYDSAERWRKEGTSVTNTINIRNVTVHELGHNLGFSHDTKTASIMYPFYTDTNFNTLYPSGFQNNAADRFATTRIYGGKHTVWCINRVHRAAVRTGVDLFSRPAGTGWRIINNLRIKRLAVGTNGLVYVVSRNRASKIYARTGLSSSNRTGTGWSLMSHSFRVRDISVGVSNRLWAANVNGKVFIRQGITANNIKGTSWLLVSSLPRMIAISASGNGHVFGIDFNGHMFVRLGVTVSTPQGTSWSRVPGNKRFKQLSCGYESTLWAIDRRNRICYRSGITDAVPAGTSWILSGYGKQVTTDVTGEVWMINKRNRVHRRRGIDFDSLRGSGWNNVPASGIIRNISSGYVR